MAFTLQSADGRAASGSTDFGIGGPFAAGDVLLVFIAEYDTFLVNPDAPTNTPPTLTLSDTAGNGYGIVAGPVVDRGNPPTPQGLVLYQANVGSDSIDPLTLTVALSNNPNGGSNASYSCFILHLANDTPGTFASLAGVGASHGDNDTASVSVGQANGNLILAGLCQNGGTPDWSGTPLSEAINDGLADDAATGVGAQDSYNLSVPLGGVGDWAMIAVTFTAIPAAPLPPPGPPDQPICLCEKTKPKGWAGPWPPPPPPPGPPLNWWHRLMGIVPSRNPGHHGGLFFQPPFDTVSNRDRIVTALVALAAAGVILSPEIIAAIISLGSSNPAQLQQVIQEVVSDPGQAEAIIQQIGQMAPPLPAAEAQVQQIARQLAQQIRDTIEALKQTRDLAQTNPGLRECTGKEGELGVGSKIGTVQYIDQQIAALERQLAELEQQYGKLDPLPWQSPGPRAFPPWPITGPGAIKTPGGGGLPPAPPGLDGFSPQASLQGFSRHAFSANTFRAPPGPGPAMYGVMASGAMHTQGGVGGGWAQLMGLPVFGGTGVSGSCEVQGSGRFGGGPGGVGKGSPGGIGAAAAAPGGGTFQVSGQQGMGLYRPASQGGGRLYA